MNFDPYIHNYIPMMIIIFKYKMGDNSHLSCKLNHGFMVVGLGLCTEFWRDQLTSLR
jgi:hypothetical protein